MIINVVRRWNNNPSWKSVILGRVVSKETDWTKATEEIEKLWERFNVIEPDSDYEFLEYLAKHGFETLSENIEFTVTLS
jgi:hypothetical protein